MTNTPDPPDRRKSPRFRVALPVELDGGTGITCNVSVSGVFFETDQSFSPGEPIRLTLVLEYVDPAHPIRLHCRGQVVRVEPRDRHVGVAVAIAAFRFEAPNTPELWQESGEVKRLEDAATPPDQAGFLGIRARCAESPGTPTG